MSTDRSRKLFNTSQDIRSFFSFFVSVSFIFKFFFSFFPFVLWLLLFCYVCWITYGMPHRARDRSMFGWTYNYTQTHNYKVNCIIKRGEQVATRQTRDTSTSISLFFLNIPYRLVTKNNSAIEAIRKTKKNTKQNKTKMQKSKTWCLLPCLAHSFFLTIAAYLLPLL